MTIPSFRFPARLAVCVCAGLLVLAACNISQEEKVDSTISFNKIYDDLAVYDSVVIALKDSQGRTLDIVYKGKVENPSDVENLAAPHWDGGKVIVSITGFNAAGDEIYRIEAGFDGKTNQKDSVKTFRFPGSSLSIPDRALVMAEGDSLSLPTVTVEPANLADKTLLWSSSDMAVAEIRGAYIKAMGPGSVEITARLQADPSVTVKVQVTVELGGRIPETLALALDTLFVPAGGASRIIQVKVMPLTASAAVTWRSDNALVATVAEDGAISGLVAGVTKVRAASKIKPSLSDSAWVMVTEPIPVASVRFISDSVDIFIGGAAELLGVEVLPLEANQAVDFTALDPDMVELKDNRISGLAEGLTTVTVKSKEDSTKQDILKVRIHPNRHVDSVRVTPKSLKLFVGGEKLGLTGKVYPASAPQDIQWVSGNMAYATVDADGKVAAVAAGNLKVYAYSQADSLARDSAIVAVKVDPPVVRIGEDTVVSVGQTITFLPVVEAQEFGLVTGFKWDLDGDSAWDDSAAAVRSVSYKYDQEKVYKVRFWVKDTEGNETVVSKSVRAVKGAVVLIQSPLNNSYSRVAVIAVKWTVDGAEQDSLKSQTLKDGPNTITRTVKDAAGKPFSHSITVTLDSVAPAKPQVHGPALVASTAPTWSWTSGGGGGNGVFRSALDAEDLSKAVETKDTLYMPATALSEGVHTLFVQERDVAGNWSASGKLAIKIDVTAPGAPAYTTQPATPLNKLDSRTSLVWSWGAVAGADSFVVKMNGNEVARQVGTTYTVNSLTDQTYTLEVQAKDLAGNASAYAASVSMLVDRVSPNAPDLSQPPSPRKSALWIWTGGGGGNGVFKCSLDGGSEFACTSPYNLNPTEGDHTLRIRESDAAGNMSAYSSTTVTIDLQKPLIANSNYNNVMDRVFNTLKAFTGTASDERGLKKVTYKVDAGTLNSASGTQNWTFMPTLSDGTHILTIIATDNADNLDSIQLIVTYKPKVKFVRKGANGSGTSWSDAKGELWTLLEPGLTYSSGDQVWVTEGTYAPNPSREAFYPPYNLGIYGGFSDKGTDISVEGRSIMSHPTILSHGSGSQIIWNGFNNGSKYEYRDHFTWDGFYITSIPAGAIIEVRNDEATSALTGIAFNNFIINNIDAPSAGPKISLADAHVTMKNFQLTRIYTGVSTLHGISISGIYVHSSLTCEGCHIDNNYSDGDFGSIVDIYNATVDFKNSTITNNKFFYNTIPAPSDVFLDDSSILKYQKSTTTIDKILYDGGTILPY